MILEQMDIVRECEMAKRLAWLEIQEKYPDPWVALSDAEYVDDDGCNVKSAIVMCGIPDDKYIDCRLDFVRSGKDYRYKRTEDSCNFLGVTI